MTMRVVIDTHVALELWHFHDPRVAALRSALDARRVRLVTDAHCRAEWQRVLRYPALKLDAARCAELEQAFDAETLQFDRAGATAGTPLPSCANASAAAALPSCADAAVATSLPHCADAVVAAPLPRCADPDDQKFLELARDAGAAWLLSRDAALLALARRCERQHGFRIVPPERFGQAR